MSTQQSHAVDISMIMDDIRGEPGELYLEHFAHWHHKLSSAREEKQDQEMYRRLASVAKEAEAIGEKELALTFAELAAIGLGRSTRGQDSEG